MDKGKRKSVTSKVSVKSQTVLPREVREKLKLEPGDTIRYVIDQKGVHIDKLPLAEDDLFIAFTEWSSLEDEEDFAHL